MGAESVRGGDVQSIFEHRGIRIDFSEGVVYRGKAQVRLSSVELRLLSALFESRGWLVDHDELVRRVWGVAPKSYKRNLKLYICYLRRKIEADPKRPALIVNRRGLGYMFSATNGAPLD